MFKIPRHCKIHLNDFKTTIKLQPFICSLNICLHMDLNLTKVYHTSYSYFPGKLQASTQNTKQKKFYTLNTYSC